MIYNRKIVESKDAPDNKNVLWLDASQDTRYIRAYVKGEWISLGDTAEVIDNLAKEVQELSTSLQEFKDTKGQASGITPLNASKVIDLCYFPSIFPQTIADVTELKKNVTTLSQEVGKLMDSYVEVICTEDSTICGVSCPAKKRTRIDASKIENLNNVFGSKLYWFGGNHLDISSFTNLYKCFYNASQMVHCNVSGWDTSNVTDLNSVFYGCSNLISLDVSGWDTSNVTNLYGAFQTCAYLKSLDLSGWDVSSVTDMNSTFSACTNLATIDISNWNTCNVTTMFKAFGYCNSLTDITIYNWNTEKVTNMSEMFVDCFSLSALNLAKWSTKSCTSMDNMFKGCYNLTSLMLGNNWGTQTAGLTLDLHDLGKNADYTLNEATYSSLYLMYNRATAGLDNMIIKMNSKHNLPDGWKDNMETKGYTITLV